MSTDRDDRDWIEGWGEAPGLGTEPPAECRHGVPRKLRCEDCIMEARHQHRGGER